MSILTRILLASVVIAALVTHGTAAPPKAVVSVEPLEGNTIVYLVRAPEKGGGPAKGQFSLRLSVLNQESKQIRLNKVVVSFPNVAGATIAADLNIGAGGTGVWANKAKENVIVPVPAPKTVTLVLHFDGFKDPVSLTRPFAPHKSPVFFGAYLFPAKASDLRVNEYWTGAGNHGEGFEGSQLFAYDMGVIGFDDNTKNWSEVLPGKKGDKNSDWRIWGKPIHAMADGTVLEAVNNVPNNPKPMDAKTEAERVRQADEQAEKYWGKNRFPNGGAGNHFYIQHGDEVMLYAHMQPGSLNKALLAAGARVKAGDFLGLAGNSGSSSNPHLHIHTVQGKAPEQGPLRPLPFRGIHVVARNLAHTHDPNSPWMRVSGAGLPGIPTHIWPDNDKPTWYPPGLAEVAKHGIPQAQYQAEFEKIASSGYRLVWIDGYSVNGQAFYNIIFRPVNGIDWIAKHGLTGAQYEAEFQKHGKAGFRLTHVDCYDTSSGIHYAAIWSKAKGPDYIAYHGRDSADHQKQFEKLTKEGWHPTVISVASSGGKRQHAAIYVKGNVGALWSKPAIPQADFQKEFNDNVKAGRELVYLNAYRHDGKVFFTGIWYSKAGNPSVAHHGLSGKQYQSEFDLHTGQGMLTRVVTGYEVNNTHTFAGVWKK